jgi:hypothetical protein
MSTTNHKFNQRKRRIELAKREMKKDGFEFKKIVKNTITFFNPETSAKVRRNLEEWD